MSKPIFVALPFCPACGATDWQETAEWWVDGVFRADSLPPVLTCQSCDHVTRTRLNYADQQRIAEEEQEAKEIRAALREASAHKDKRRHVTLADLARVPE